MSQTSIEQTSLWADISDVMHAVGKPTRFEYRAMLHTEKEDLPVLKIDNMDLVRDYVNSIGDLVRVEFKMGLGEYMMRLYPYRTNLEFTIKRVLLTDESDKISNSKITTVRYKAVFLTDENPNHTSTEYEQMDTDTLNNTGTIQVKLQLLNRSLEPIRIKTVQGVFKQVTPKKIIHSLLAGESLKVQVDGKAAIDGIDIVEPDNTAARAHVVIPSSTPITSLPSYLQEKMGGVYSTGIGNYLQLYNKKMLWFVYPTWNTKRFDKSKDDKLIVYALPQGRFSALDRTYHKDASILKILVTGQRTYSDSADVDYMNKGSGFRMADARAFMSKPVEITADGPKMRRGNFNTEVAAEARSDGLNYAPRTDSPSSNPFKEYSKVTARNIARIDIVWENADPELLYPGMPCQYTFLDNNIPVTLRGTVGFVHAITQLQGKGISGKTYMTNCTIVLLCEQKVKTRKLPTTAPQGATF